MKRASFFAVISASAALGLWACSSDGGGIDYVDPASPGAPPLGFGGSGGPGSAPTVPAAPTTSPNGAPTETNNCGIQKVPLERQPAELLVVLDKSGSMDQDLPGGGEKWDTVTAVLDEVIKATEAGVHWGLKLYPLASSCGVSNGAEVPAAINNHARIMTVIQREGPAGATPTEMAIQKAAAYMKSRKTPFGKHLLLATDGLPNCLETRAGSTDNEQVRAIKAVADAAAEGLPTYVVGIATGTEADTTLNMMAEAGGRPRTMAMRKYYAAGSRAQLVDALSNIAGQVGSCSFGLNKAPPSPNDVAVKVDGARIERDTTHMSGWDYGSGQSIQFFGELCEKLKSGAAKDVQFIFGCPGQIIE